MLAPLNHSVFYVGENVTFSVSVDDPDIRFGQTLNVSWSSDISGDLMRLTSDDDLLFMTDGLGLGTHRVEVRVDDGTYSSTGWLEVTIVQRPTPPQEPPDLWVASTQPLLILLVIIVVLVLVILYLYYDRRGSSGGRTMR
jgi:hypothetical protein